MVKELEIQPISLFDQSLDELIDATEDTGATIERGTVIAMPPQSKLREIMILDTYEEEYSSGLFDRYAVVKTASEDGSGIVEILLQSNDEYEDTLSAVLRQLRSDAVTEMSKETKGLSLNGIVALPSAYRYLQSIDADIEGAPEDKKRLIRSSSSNPNRGLEFLQDAVAVREQLTDGPLLVTGIDGQIISLVLQPNDEVEVSKYAYNPESRLYDETYKDSVSFGEATEFARMELEDEITNGGVRTSCSGVFPIGYEALAFMRYGAQLVEKYGTEISVDDINDIGILADIQQDRSIIIPGTTSSTVAGPLFSNGIENQLMYEYKSSFGNGKRKTIFSPDDYTDSDTFFTLTSSATLIKGADIRRALLSGELERTPEAGTRAYSSEELSILTDAEFDAIVGSGNAIAVPVGADTSVRTGTPYPIDEGSSVVNGVAGRFSTKTIDGIEVQRGGIRLTFDAFVRADDDSGTTLLSRQQLEDTASRVIVAPILFDRTVGFESEQLPDNTTLGSIDNLEEIARRGGLIKYVLPNGEVEVVLPYVAEDGLTSYIRSSYRVLIDSTLKEAGRLDLSTVDYLNIAPITGEIIYPAKTVQTTASTRLRPPVNTRSESTFTSLELNGRQYPIAKKATKAPVFMSGVAADVKLDPKQTELVPNIPDNTQAIFANAPNARALGQVVATELAGIDGFLSSFAERDDLVGFNTIFMSLRMRDRLSDNGEAKYATTLDVGVVAEYPGTDSMTMFRYELLKNAKALGLRNTTISDTVQTAVRLEYAADSDEVVIAAKSSFGDETVLRKDVAVELFSPRALAWLKQATGRNTRSVNLELLFDERGLRIDAVSINSRQGKQKPRSGPDQADRIPLEVRKLAQ